MNKIYKKNNYIIITGPDIISEFPITNIYVDKQELTNEYYIYFNSVTSKCVAIVSVPNILKENDTPYTQEEWETFYTVNTGFFFNVGGGGDTGSIPADQFVDTYSDLPDPTTVIYQIWIVKNSEGTSWLPGSLGGTYYPEGGYASDGIKWVYHKDSYQASQLEVDAGTVTNKWLTPFTFENAAKWSDKYDASNPSGYQTASQVQAIADAKVSNEAYNATTWSGVTGVAPSKGVLKNKFQEVESEINTKQTQATFDPTKPTIALIGEDGKIVFADTNDFPTPTELTYGKGVTAPIQGQIDDKVDKITPITGATKTKVTYNAQGQITSGADASLNDLSDVNITTPTTNHVLIYDGLGEFRNTLLTTSYISNFGAGVLATVLTGVSFLTGGAIVSTDTVLVAFGKLQKQINDLGTIYQALLVSGTNIKTINGSSVLGSGDLVVSGGTTTSGTYTGTIAVTGTTAPSGTTNHSFTFTEVDKLISLRVNLDWAVAGVAITSIACELPAGCPTPALPSGVSTALDVLNYGTGIIHTAKTVATTSLPFCALRLKSTSPNVFEVVVNRPSANYRYGYFSIQYFKA